MHVMIVYDSKFGNTESIAEAMWETMRGHAEVEILQASVVQSIPDDLDLLVVGGPTQAHGVEATMQHLLEAIPPERVRDLSLAVFDTRMKWPRLLTGSAAYDIAGRLKDKGARLIDAPQSFFVGGREGPLLDHELSRASAWSDHLLKVVPQVHRA